MTHTAPSPTTSSAPWVSGTTVTVDENIMKWVDQTKEYTDKGYNNQSSLWDSSVGVRSGPHR